LQFFPVNLITFLLSDEISGNDSDDEIEEDPVLEHKSIKCRGGINRIRAMPSGSAHCVGVWSELGYVNIYDISQQVQSFDTPGLMVGEATAPIHQIKHRSEGFALDWSQKVEGQCVIFNGLTIENISRILFNFCFICFCYT
jgi:ribosome assembly protein RRB1